MRFYCKVVKSAQTKSESKFFDLGPIFIADSYSNDFWTVSPVEKLTKEQYDSGVPKWLYIDKQYIEIICKVEDITLSTIKAYGLYYIDKDGYTIPVTEFGERIICCKVSTATRLKDKLIDKLKSPIETKIPWYKKIFKQKNASSDTLLEYDKTLRRQIINTMFVKEIKIID